MLYACVSGVCSVSVVYVCVFGTQIHFLTGLYGGHRLLLEISFSVSSPRIYLPLFPSVGFARVLCQAVLFSMGVLGI